MKAYKEITLLHELNEKELDETRIEVLDALLDGLSAEQRQAVLYFGRVIHQRGLNDGLQIAKHLNKA